MASKAANRVVVGSRGPRTRKPGNVRDQIIDAAEECFAVSGFERTTLEQVGAQVGLSRGAVLYHVKDKAELFTAVLQQIFLPFQLELRRVLLESASLMDRFEALVDTIVEYAVQQPNAPRLLLRELPIEGSAVQEALRNFNIDTTRLIDGALEAAYLEGLASKPIDPRLFVSAIAGTVICYVGGVASIRGIRTEELITPERIDELKGSLHKILRVFLDSSPGPATDA